MSASGLRSRATATSRAEASIPAHEAPRRPASSIASPDPQATSSSRSPASTPSRWCIATYSRQLPGSLSVAKSTALRPQPSSTITHCGVSVLGLVIARSSALPVPLRCGHRSAGPAPGPAEVAQIGTSLRRVAVPGQARKVPGQAGLPEPLIHALARWRRDGECLKIMRKSYGDRVIAGLTCFPSLTINMVRDTLRGKR